MKDIFNMVPQVLAPPDSDPPEQSVKHFIFVDPSFVLAKRPTYPLGEEKLVALHTQVKELVDKG